jgi:electron transfer flavoprotein beta subunit
MLYFRAYGLPRRAEAAAGLRLCHFDLHREQRVSLRIAVLAKQVPDTQNITGQAMNDDGTVNRAALPAIFNPEDLNALEEALRLREVHGGRVTVISMGPPAAAQVLRESLYRGADEVILLSDGPFAGADTLATSYALCLGVRRIGYCDLVLCGRQAIDGDTAQVGPQLAEKLGFPQITCVSRIDAIDDGFITATRSIEGGFETVRAPLPALLTITGEANDPRPPSARLVMTYKHADAQLLRPYDDSYLDPESEEAEVCMIDRRGRPVCRARIVLWDAEAVQARREEVGLRGSPTRVKKITSVQLLPTEAKMVEPTDEGVTSLVHELIEEHILG